MTPEQQRIAIAEWCGWTITGESCDGEYYSIQGYPKGGSLSDKQVSPPDYPNNLNAMHEAFARLERVLQARFGEELAYILGIEHWTNCKLIIRAVMKATAAQRAEALLKTIGKWEEAVRV